MGPDKQYGLYTARDSESPSRRKINRRRKDEMYLQRFDVPPSLTSRATLLELPWREGNDVLENITSQHTQVQCSSGADGICTYKNSLLRGMIDRLPDIRQFLKAGGIEHELL